MTSGAEDFLAAAIPGLLLYAAAADLLHRRIPNSVCAAFALVALSWQLLQGPFRIWDPLLAGLSIFLPLTWFWSRGWLGGGDVKLATAIALWAGFSGLPAFLLVSTLAGGGIALAGMLLPSFVRHLEVALASLSALGLRPAAGLAGGLLAPARSVPYGLALATGGLWLWVQRFLAN